MLTYLRDDIFESPAQTIVNTVNTVGVMGKGIALRFKHTYPDMFEEYASLCKANRIQIGRLHLWRTASRWIINFPTKTTWRKPSQIDYIKAGLETFVTSYREMGISSISFPPLGCGNGNLSWEEVRPVMEAYLSRLPINVFVHDRQVSTDFIPEHKEAPSGHIPLSFPEFVQDINQIMQSSSANFKTLSDTSKFSAEWTNDGGIVILRGSRSDFIDVEYLERAWTALQAGVLTADQFAGQHAQKVKSYLFAILFQLPYVRAVELNKPSWSTGVTAYGLLLKQNRANEDLFNSSNLSAKGC